MESGKDTRPAKLVISVITVLVSLGTLVALLCYLFGSLHVANASPPPAWEVLAWCLAIYLFFTLYGAFFCGGRWLGKPKEIAWIAAIPHLIAVVPVATFPFAAVIPIATFVIYYRMARRFGQKAGSTWEGALMG